jgi:hypothetical protein
LFLSLLLLVLVLQLLLLLPVLLVGVTGSHAAGTCVAQAGSTCSRTVAMRSTGGHRSAMVVC